MAKVLVVLIRDGDPELGDRWDRHVVEIPGEGYSVINQEGVLEACKLDLERITEGEHAVYKRGGILTIMHPIFCLHAMAIIPYDVEAGQVLAINSWLGPVVIKLGWTELDDLLPYRNLPKHWSRRV